MATISVFPANTATGRDKKKKKKTHRNVVPLPTVVNIIRRDIFFPIFLFYIIISDMSPASNTTLLVQILPMTGLVLHH